jgi:orotidine-5'-phosphate decarboxylase
LEDSLEGINLTKLPHNSKETIENPWHKSWQRLKRTGSMLCVGLDPDPGKMPADYASSHRPFFDFCRDIVDATAPSALAFKPQIAFFSSQGREGELEALMEYIRTQYPEHLLILDAKRGDIGNTASHYAREAFERYGADVVTVNPYMGWDTIEPYLTTPSKGAFVLCKTSNPGSSWLQDLRTADGIKIFEKLAQDCEAKNASATNRVGLVVGATDLDSLRAILRLSSEITPLLIPGVGAQGARWEDVVKELRNAPHPPRLAFVNVGRELLYNSTGLKKNVEIAATKAAALIK